MKILYTHYLTDPQHPAVQMVEHIAYQLRAIGHDVKVHATAGLKRQSRSLDAAVKKTSRAKRGKLQSVKAKLWFAKAMARNLKWQRGDQAAIESFDPDVVLVRQDAYCGSAIKASLKADKPVVTYADAPVAYETRLFNSEGRWHPSGLVERIEKWTLDNSKAVITVSNPAARRLSEYEIETPIHVNHNGIDVARFPGFCAEDRHKIRKALGFGESIVIGFQGTFKAFHGIERLRELMLWSAKFPQISWLLIGDGPERENLQEAVQGKVEAKFLGRQPADEMGILMSAMDIAVAPHSQLDGDFYFCPLKLLEYAASGAATIASDQGDIPILMADGQGAEIVSVDDCDAWTAALEKLIRDGAYRAKIARDAQQHVMENLTWRNTAINVDRILSQTLGVAPLYCEEIDDVPTIETDSASQLAPIG